MAGDAGPRVGDDEVARMGAVAGITVFLADDSVIVREGVRALLDLEEDLHVVGTAEDYDGLV
ncbi:MAG: DNA-binding response regulator, partial [Nitriliruptor sp.]